ncbi:FixH family protein [Massilia sp. DWR3-1-1]|uniref:FixH family protein n=1 Tax=Massilia sp. DWR3-1-1 TaxID=2804559 RepID=UPI003CFA332B
MPTTVRPFAAAANDEAPWYRHRWPWLLMIGPAWVLVAGAVMGYQAASRPDAMVVDDYYRQGKAINQDLRRDRAAAARAVVVDLEYAAGQGGATLRGVITAAGTPLPGLLHLRLVHPTLPEKDIALTVTADAAGAFAAPLALLEATRWQVQLEGGARDWRLARQWSRPAAFPHLRVIPTPAEAAPLD